MMHRMKGGAALLSVLLLGGAAFAQDGSQYLRKSETPGGVIALEIASRDFVRPEAAGDVESTPGPRVGLIAVAHIADRAFYRRVQQLLDQYDIVLYEAVRPAGVEGARGDTDEERIASTKRAARFVASVIEAHRESQGRYPGTLDELREFASGIDPIVINWLAAATIDAWGEPLEYRPGEGGSAFTLATTAAPGLDRITITNEDAVPPLALDRDNIQKQLASAIGLAYQLDSLNYGAPNWRSSDMSIDELAQAFSEKGLDLGPLQSTLGGSSLTAQLGRVLLRMIAMLDAMAEGMISDLVKVLMIDLLGDEALLEHGLGQLGEGFTEVIINERNQVVLDDLRRLIEEEPEVRSVAILYGAGHMADLDERLCDEFGYERSEEHWLTAMSVDLRTSRLDEALIVQMRRTLQRSLSRQLPARRQQ